MEREGGMEKEQGRMEETTKTRDNEQGRESKRRHRGTETNTQRHKTKTPRH